MIGAAIGENKTPPRQALQGRLQSGIRRQVAQIDVMHEAQIVFGIAVMLAHQAVQGGAVLAIKLFLHRPRRVAGEAEKALDIVGHAAFDLREDAVIGAVQGIIQVENPVPDMPKIRPGIEPGIRLEMGIFYDWGAFHGPEHGAGREAAQGG